MDIYIESLDGLPWYENNVIIPGEGHLIYHILWIIDTIDKHKIWENSQSIWGSGVSVNIMTFVTTVVGPNMGNTGLKCISDYCMFIVY